MIRFFLIVNEDRYYYYERNMTFYEGNLNKKTESTKITYIHCKSFTFIMSNEKTMFPTPLKQLLIIPLLSSKVYTSQIAISEQSK